MKEETLRDTQIKKHARDGRNEESSRITSRRNSLCKKLIEKRETIERLTSQIQEFAREGELHASDCEDFQDSRIEP